MSSVFGSNAYRGQLSFLEEEEEKPKVTGLDVTFGVTSGGNEASVVVISDVEDLNVRGGGGAQFVDIRGDVDGGNISLGSGDDSVVARPGSVVDGVEFDLGSGDDQLDQLAGATFRDVDVFGGDGSDRLYFAGHNVDTLLDPGENEEIPDTLIFQDTVTGNIEASDSESWKQKPKDKSEWGKDVILLAGDWSGRDGKRHNTNLFGGGGEKAYGGFQRSENGQVLADLDITGDHTNFEYVARIDEHGKEIGTLQSIEPEMVFENMWAKYTGQVLVIAGAVIPGAQFLIPIGLGFQTAFEVDNNIASFETTGLNLIQGAADATGIGWLSRGVRVGASAYRGDYGGAAIGLASFMPKGSVAQTGLQVGGTGYRSYQAAERGNVPGAIIGATSIPGMVGWDSSGWIARGGEIAGNGYGFGKAIGENDVDAAIAYGTRLPNNLGFDDDRTIVGLGDYTRGLYKIGSFEFGRNDLVTDLLDLGSAVTPDFERGTENFAYQAPPEIHVDENGRLVLEDPEDVAAYRQYIAKFVTEEGFDMDAFAQEVNGSNLSGREKSLLIGRFGTEVQQGRWQEGPGPEQVRPEDLPEGGTLVRARDPVSGQVIGNLVPEDQADAVAQSLWEQGFEGVETVHSAPPEEIEFPELPEGHVYIIGAHPETGKTVGGGVPVDQAPSYAAALAKAGVDPRTIRAVDPAAQGTVVTGTAPVQDSASSTPSSSDSSGRPLEEFRIKEDNAYLYGDLEFGTTSTAESGEDTSAAEQEDDEAIREDPDDRKARVIDELRNSRANEPANRLNFPPASAELKEEFAEGRTPELSDEDEFYSYIDYMLDTHQGDDGIVDLAAAEEEMTANGVPEDKRQGLLNGLSAYPYSGVTYVSDDGTVSGFGNGHDSLVDVSEWIDPEDIVPVGGPNDAANNGIVVERDDGSVFVFRDPGPGGNTLLAAQEAGIDFDDIVGEVGDDQPYLPYYTDEIGPIEEYTLETYGRTEQDDGEADVDEEREENGTEDAAEGDADLSSPDLSGASDDADYGFDSGVEIGSSYGDANRTAADDDVSATPAETERDGAASTTTYQLSSESADEHDWDTRRLRIRDENGGEYTYASDQDTLTTIAHEGSIDPADIVVYGGEDDIADDGVVVLDDNSVYVFRDPGGNTLQAFVEGGGDLDDIVGDVGDDESFDPDGNGPVEEFTPETFPDSTGQR